MMSATVLGMATGRRTSLAGTIGSLLEWYDFTVYGLLAPILGKLFFPADDPLASLLAAFGVFAIGYATRPLGGAVFGHIGDKFGHKPAMIISSVMMGLATLGIGLLPVHAQIGTTAAVLLVVLQIFQGFSVDREFTDGVMLAEHAPNERRGFVASWRKWAAWSACCSVPYRRADEQRLGEAEMRLGAGDSVSIRRGDRRFQRRIEAADHRVPWLAMSFVPPAHRSSPHSAITGGGLRMVCLLLMQGIGFYMVFVYAASYLTEQMHVTTARALDIDTLAFLAMLAGASVAAIVSDRLGRAGPVFCRGRDVRSGLAPLGADAPSKPCLDPHGADRLRPVDGTGLRGNAGHHDRDASHRGPLQRRRDRLQSLLRDVRRHDAVDRHLSGCAHGRRFRPGLIISWPLRSSRSSSCSDCPRRRASHSADRGRAGPLFHRFYGCRPWGRSWSCGHGASSASRPLPPTPSTAGCPAISSW